MILILQDEICIFIQLVEWINFFKDIKILIDNVGVDMSRAPAPSHHFTSIY